MKSVPSISIIFCYTFRLLYQILSFPLITINGMCLIARFKQFNALITSFVRCPSNGFIQYIKERTDCGSMKNEQLVYSA